MLGPVAQPWAEARRKAQPGAVEGRQTPPAMLEQVAVRQTPAEVVAGQTLAEAVVPRQTQVAGQTLAEQGAAGQTQAAGRRAVHPRSPAEVVAGQTPAERVAAAHEVATREARVLVRALEQQPRVVVQPLACLEPSAVVVVELPAWAAFLPWSIARLHPQALQPIASSSADLPHLRID